MKYSKYVCIQRDQFNVLLCGHVYMEYIYQMSLDWLMLHLLITWHMSTCTTYLLIKEKKAETPFQLRPLNKFGLIFCPLANIISPVVVVVVVVVIQISSVFYLDSSIVYKLLCSCIFTSSYTHMYMSKTSDEPFKTLFPLPRYSQPWMSTIH